MKKAKVTLEQWQTLKAVIDEGSFAKAADALNKSQSTVSYAISKLEEQLPSPVLTMEGRKAVLTEEGKVLYRRAVSLLELALEIEQTAKSLADGWETQLTICVDSIAPISPVFDAIHHFSTIAPQTRITLIETNLSGTIEALLEKRAELVLTAQMPPGFLGKFIGDVQMIPVAHANHPLARETRKLKLGDLQKHRQIVVRRQCGYYRSSLRPASLFCPLLRDTVPGSLPPLPERGYRLDRAIALRLAMFRGLSRVVAGR